MIKILKNPNPAQEFVLTCNKCQCKFSFTNGDTYKMQSLFGTTGFEPTVTKCPNCGHELLVRQ